MFNEQALIEESKKHFEEFLQKQQRSLATFTGDPSLVYTADENLEKFLFKSSKGVLYLPLASFLDKNLDENQIMWHIYNELALYPDWKKETKKYLNRKIDWQKEIDNMTIYILDRIKKEGLEKDPAYEPKIISNYVKKEILQFLYVFDKYVSFLRVLQICPLYRDEENYKELISYMKEIKKTTKSISSIPKHKSFTNSFLILELYGEELIMKNHLKLCLNKKIFNQPYYEFIRYELIKQINKEEGILRRDPFIRSFIYPTFEKLWKQEIDDMEFYQSQGKADGNSKENREGLKESQTEVTQDMLESSQDDVEKILEEMLEQENERINDIENTVEGNLDLESYGISQGDQELFRFYSNKMKKERAEMRKFWIELMGSVQSEIYVKKDREIKGKLDVYNFIDFYPDFLEAEKKGNYNDLSIFNRYSLEPQADILPEKIEISFVIDNSGSMNQSKIEEARKALAVTLLSIDDFNEYLKSNRAQLNQKIEVLSETWFFGSNYYNVKEFNHKGKKEKNRSDIIRSIVKLDATDGSTDEASCLKEISNNITPIQERKLKKGKEIKIVFQITDGASSFPGAAKEAVQELLSKNVLIYAFQIGKNSDADEKVFKFVWNEGHKDLHGIIIGEEIEKLPKELLKAVGQNIKSVFKLNY